MAGNSVGCTVMATMAVKNALVRLLPRLEEAAGQAVMLRVGTIADLQSEIERDAAFDVAILSTAAIGRLLSQGFFAAGSPVPVASGGLGIAIPKDATVGPPNSPADVRSMLLDAKRIAMSGNGGSHEAIRSMFQALGVSEAVNDKLLLLSGIAPPQAIATGQADLGICQVSEIVGVQGIRLAGPLPGRLQVRSHFSAAISRRALDGFAASDLVRCLISHSSRDDWIVCGLSPA